LLRVFPYRIVFIFKEKRAIASIFRIDIQLARSDRPAHYGSRSQLHFIYRRNAVTFQHLQNDIAEQRAFRIDF
jgi:hypothetical protein